MSVAELERPTITGRRSRVQTPKRGPVRGRGRGRGRATTPELRPGSTVPAPSVGQNPSARATLGGTDSRRAMPRACVAEAGRADPAFVGRSPRPSWQLTDRGIALVLVVAAMVVMAALAVVVPTALRVTGDHYQPVGTSQLAQP